MNNTNNTTNANGSVATTTPEGAVMGSDGVLRQYRPRLSFYHANSKNSGSAARFELVPATGVRDGAIFLTLAPQKSIANGTREQGTRQFATFDWQNRITVKLNFSDLCHMLLVLNGKSDNIAAGKGLFHDSRDATTVINLARQDEPYAGYALDISRRNKGSDSGTRLRILLNHTEAYGLAIVLESALSVVALGIPANSRRIGGSNDNTSEPDQDEPLPF